jgi:hypothetical protein
VITAMFKPEPREAAVILLHALDERGQRRGRPLTRARLSRLTLTKLWNREQLTENWIREVNEWLLSAGWALIQAGATFGVVKTEIVENWPRVASKHSKELLEKVACGNFDFSTLEPLFETKARTTPTPAERGRRRRARA